VLRLEDESGEARSLSALGTLRQVGARVRQLPAIHVQDATIQQRPARVDGIRVLDVLERLVERVERLLGPAGAQVEEPAQPGERRVQPVEPGQLRLDVTPPLVVALDELDRRTDSHARDLARRWQPVQEMEDGSEATTGERGLTLGVLDRGAVHDGSEPPEGVGSGPLRCAPASDRHRR
jgi:hypothetical protein